MAPLLQRLSRSRRDREPKTSNDKDDHAATARTKAAATTLTNRLVLRPMKGRSSAADPPDVVGALPAKNRSSSSNRPSSNTKPPTPPQKQRKSSGKSKRQQKKPPPPPSHERTPSDFLSTSQLDLIHDVSLYVKEQDGVNDNNVKKISLAAAAAAAAAASSPASTAATAPMTSPLDTIDGPFVPPTPARGARAQGGGEEDDTTDAASSIILSTNDSINVFFEEGATPADRVLPRILASTISAIPHNAVDDSAAIDNVDEASIGSESAILRVREMHGSMGGNQGGGGMMARPRSLQNEFDAAGVGSQQQQQQTLEGGPNNNASSATNDTSITLNPFACGTVGTSACAKTRSLPTTSTSNVRHHQPRSGTPVNEIITSHEIKENFSPFNEINKEDNNDKNISTITDPPMQKEKGGTKKSVLWGCKACNRQFKTRDRALRHERVCRLNTTAGDDDGTTTPQDELSYESYDDEWDDEPNLYDEIIDALCCNITVPAAPAAPRESSGSSASSTGSRKKMSGRQNNKGNKWQEENRRRLV